MNDNGSIYGFRSFRPADLKAIVVETAFAPTRWDGFDTFKRDLYPPENVTAISIDGETFAQPRHPISTQDVLRHMDERGLEMTGKPELRGGRPPRYLITVRLVRTLEE